MPYTYSHFSFSILHSETKKNGSQRKKKKKYIIPFCRRYQQSCFAVKDHKEHNASSILRFWNCAHNTQCETSRIEPRIYTHQTRETKKKYVFATWTELKIRRARAEAKGGGGHGEIVKGVFKMKNHCYEIIRNIHSEEEYYVLARGGGHGGPKIKFIAVVSATTPAATATV